MTVVENFPPSIVASTPAAYRTAITASDVLARVGTITTSAVAGGSLTGVTTYNLKIVAGNALGETDTAAAVSQGTTTNLTVRGLFAQVPNATYYDVYLSTDVDPKFVGRITEAQRASGILITAVNVTGAGGVAGGVDIQVPGTGQQSLVTRAVNTAYVIPASPVVCTGKQYVDFDLLMSDTGDIVSPALTVVPYSHNATATQSFAGTPVTLAFGGTTGTFGALAQRLRIGCQGNDAVSLVIQSIAGTGAAVSMWATTS